jgi:hypothetical protein
MDQPTKNAWWAAVLNFVLPGLGYLYTGRKRQFFSVGLLVSSVIAYFSPALWRADLDAAAVLSALLFSVTVAIDGHRDAQGAG